MNTKNKKKSMFPELTFYDLGGRGVTSERSTVYIFFELNIELWT